MHSSWGGATLGAHYRSKTHERRGIRLSACMAQARADIAAAIDVVRMITSRRELRLKGREAALREGLAG